MHPILFEIGPITIHTYGFFIAFGFIGAISIARWLAVREGLQPDRVVDLAFWLLLLGLAGSRGLFVITRWDYFANNPLAVFKVWEGGLVFYGGLITAGSFGFWYVKKHRLNVWKTADVLMPGLVLNHVFGRLGCLSAGCCYGKPTDSFVGIKLYSPLVEQRLHGIPLHPTQIYSSVSLLLLFIGLLWVSKRKSFDGQVFFTYVMAYSVIRSIIEMFRGDLIRGFVVEGVLSTSQFISIFVFLGALVVLIYRLKKESRT